MPTLFFPLVMPITSVTKVVPAAAAATPAIATAVTVADQCH